MSAELSDPLPDVAAVEGSSEPCGCWAAATDAPATNVNTRDTRRTKDLIGDLRFGRPLPLFGFKKSAGDMKKRSDGAGNGHADVPALFAGGTVLFATEQRRYAPNRLML